MEKSTGKFDGDFIIRHAVPGDAGALLQMLKQIGSESDNLSFGAEGLPTTPEQEAQFLENTANGPLSVYLVAEKDGKLVGTATFMRSPRPRLSHRGEASVALVREAWGQHLGYALLSAVLEEAREKFNVEMVSLEVRSDNARAISLYRKLGFEKTGVFPGFFKIDGVYVDCDLMTLKF